MIYANLAQGIDGLFFYSYTRALQPDRKWFDEVFAPTIRELRQFTGHTSDVRGVALSPDGKLLATHAGAGATTGIASEKYFEVLNGLKAGHQIVLNPPDSLVDGDEVQVAPPAKTVAAKGDAAKGTK